MTDPADTSAAEPLWLTHHPPEQYDRCATIGGHQVCRRCLVLYPVALVAGIVSAVAWPSGTDPWLLALLPLPAVVDWWLEHLGRSQYSRARQVAVTVPAGIALGRGFARYLADPADPWFWAMVVVYGGSCLAIALWRFVDERAL